MHERKSEDSENGAHKKESCMSQLVKWMLNNVILIILAILTICFFVSTVALAHKRNCTAIKPVAVEKGLVTINNSLSCHLEQEDFYRLPKHVIPNNYNLILKPNLYNKTFSGTVVIAIKVLESTKKITLHSNKLTINSISLRRNQRNFEIKSWNTTADEREFLIVDLLKEIREGNYELLIKFVGRLDQKYLAFYASNLKNGGTMVASKFEPTYARQAFPCFDEPEFKATYDITLAKPRSYIALSNMNEVSKSPDEDISMDRVTFATSVPMSTYLAVFVICDFDFKEMDINANGIGHNFVLRSFAQKHETHKIDFALDIGKRATEFYIKYYEVPYPLPKLDMIAIPDYVSGATEHWGLITYRETSFLVDENTASARNKISVANTIAHELAHMWFGNLVTMKWWDELWLNEGFASYMQVKALNAIEPSWTMLDQFLPKTLHPVLALDSKLSSHPIVQVVETPDQITAIFDAISYNKGASILRMLEGFVGEESFRQGVSDYLKEYRFKNTVTHQLLTSIEPYFTNDHPDLDLFYIMDTWTKQSGYPLLTVGEGPGDKYVITQTRFLIDPDAVSDKDSTFKYRWFVPVTYTTNKGFQGMSWFPDTSDSITVTLKSDETWLKLNNNQVGYYRVNYPQKIWDKLIQQLRSKFGQLTISDRAQLLDDSFALAEAHAVPYELALNLSSYLATEHEYVPWETASHLFTSLSKKLITSLGFIHLQNYVQRLVEPVYKKQNWDKQDLTVIERLFRIRILSVGARFGLPDADAKTKNLFLAWLKSHGTANAAAVEPDLRQLVYYYGMKSASESEWDKLWEIYLAETDVQEQVKIRSALAAPHDAHLLKKYATLAEDETKIRSQDYLTVLREISANPSGTTLVWDEVRSRWPELVARFSLNSRYLGNLIPAITSTFNTDYKLKEMEDFFSKNKEAGAGELARKRALENVRNNIKWTARYQSAVSKWLETYETRRLSQTY